MEPPGRHKSPRPRENRALFCAWLRRPLRNLAQSGRLETALRRGNPAKT